MRSAGLLRTAVDAGDELYFLSHGPTEGLRFMPRTSNSPAADLLSVYIVRAAVRKMNLAIAYGMEVPTAPGKSCSVFASIAFCTTTWKRFCRDSFSILNVSQEC